MVEPWRPGLPGRLLARPEARRQAVVPARGACGLSISQCDRAGVVSPRDSPESQPPALLTETGTFGFLSPSSLRSGIPSRQPLLLRSHNPQPLVSQIQESKPYHPAFGTWAPGPRFLVPSLLPPATH